MHFQEKERKDLRKPWLAIAGLLAICGLYAWLSGNSDGTARVVNNLAYDRAIACFDADSVDMAIVDGVAGSLESWGTQEAIQNSINLVVSQRAHRIGVFTQPSWGELDENAVRSQIKSETLVPVDFFPSQAGSAAKAKFLASAAQRLGVDSIAFASPDESHRNLLAQVACNSGLKVANLPLAVSRHDFNFVKDVELVFTIVDPEGVVISLVESGLRR